MKTSRSVLGALLLGGLFLGGCGVGTYNIPNVEPVVKPKPEDDLLADFQAAASEDSEPSAPAEKTEKPDEKKPDEKKPDEKKAEPDKGTDKKPDDKGDAKKP
jgi:hypothetical protein